MCGQMHCTPTTQLASFLRQHVYLTITSSLIIGGRTYPCNSVVIDVGSQNADPSMAPDGAKCGDGKMCLSQQCVDVASLPVPSCSVDCGPNGVCSSMGECHCRAGFAPPDCREPGCGGSYNGGSPTPGCVNTRPEERTVLTQSMASTQSLASSPSSDSTENSTDIIIITSSSSSTSSGLGPKSDPDILHLLASNAGLVAGLVVFFVVILPLLVLGVFCGYRHRDKLRPYWQSTTTRMRNVINRGSGDNTEARRHSSKTSAPQRPRPPLVYSPSNDNNNSSDGAKMAVEPTRAAPAPPLRPTMPAAYAVSTGVSILPTRAAPTPPAKPPQPSVPPAPPAKPPKPGASQLPAEPLDPRRLRPVAAAQPDDNRPPLPQKPTIR